MYNEFILFQEVWSSDDNSLQCDSIWSLYKSIFRDIRNTEEKVAVYVGYFYTVCSTYWSGIAINYDLRISATESIVKIFSIS